MQQFKIYRQMLADWFDVKPDETTGLTEQYEQQVKKKFVDEPGQMKLLIVVDKLLTGFDAPSATYLYIDKQMRDHGLFQAICRVNRLDGDDKDYGYVVDYKDLFKSLEGAIHAYTSDALDGFDEDDVKGLLTDRVERAKADLDDALEAIRGLVEPVALPRGTQDYLHYFCAEEAGNVAQLKANEEKRYALYKCVGKVLRTFAGIADDYVEAGYDEASFQALRKEVETYEAVRTEVKLASGDYVDLKLYEPAMRHLIDTYIKADATQKISTFDDMSFVQLLAKKGADAVNDLPASLTKSEKTAAEVIENNVRRLIIDESPINPRYYEKMSELLDALIAQRRNNSLSYKEYLAQIAELAKQVVDPSASSDYPASISTPGKRAIYDWSQSNEGLTIEVDEALRVAIQDGWKSNLHKRKKVRNAVAAALGDHYSASEVDALMDILGRQSDY
jgi:type I restriction enzyme R subunit